MGNAHENLWCLCSGLPLAGMLSSHEPLSLHQTPGPPSPNLLQALVPPNAPAPNSRICEWMRASDRRVYSSCELIEREEKCPLMHSSSVYLYKGLGYHRNFSSFSWQNESSDAFPQPLFYLFLPLWTWKASSDTYKLGYNEGNGRPVSFSAPEGTPMCCCHLHGDSHVVKPRPSKDSQWLPNVCKNRGCQSTLFLLFPHPEPQQNGCGPSWVLHSLLKSIKPRFPPIKRESTFMFLCRKSIGKANVFSALLV